MRHAISQKARRSVLVLATGALIGSGSVLAQCTDALFLDGFEIPANYDWPVAVAVSQLGDNLPGRSVTFTLNGTAPLSVSSDGTYCFDATTAGGAMFAIQVTEQPTEGSVCSVDPATGTASGPFVLVQATCDLPPTRWDEFDWDGADWN